MFNVQCKDYFSHSGWRHCHIVCVSPSILFNNVFSIPISSECGKTLFPVIFVEYIHKHYNMKCCWNTQSDTQRNNDNVCCVTFGWCAVVSSRIATIASYLCTVPYWLPRGVDYTIYMPNITQQCRFLAAIIINNVKTCFMCSIVKFAMFHKC